MEVGFDLIHYVYLKEAREMVKRHINPCVLKTDCFNEVNARPIEGGIAGHINALTELVEIDKDLVEQARKMGFNARVGDIREDFGRKYDVILDLSTLDHISQEDLPRALDAYKNAMSETAEMLLFVWTAYEMALGNRQTYFDKRILDEELGKRFRVVSQRGVLRDGIGEMYQYVLCGNI